MATSLIQGVPVKKVYVDSCIPSWWIADKFNAQQKAAMDQLSEMSNDEVQLLASPAVRAEADKTTDPVLRAKLMGLVKFMAKVKAVPHSWLEPGIMQVGGMNRGFRTRRIINDPLYDQLVVVFKDNDPWHVFLGIKHDFDYFLTVDETTILKPVRRNRARFYPLCGTLEFVEPEELIAKL